MSKEWGPIQLIPPGLLGFFQLKNVGKNPDVLSSNYQPTLECRDWLYLSQQRTTDPAAYARGFVTANRGFLPWTAALIVPQDEAWFVRAYTIRSQNVPAAESIIFRPAWRALYLASVYSMGENEIVTAGQTGITGVENFFLPPGSELGVNIKECVSAGGIQLSVSLEYTALPL